MYKSIVDQLINICIKELANSSSSEHEEYGDFAEYARININTGFDKKAVKFCVEFYSICYILVVDRRIIYKKLLMKL